ncbi:double-strand break repair protein AddB [Pseudaestuariivita rosea]|uniref:double-strand break repair protein AddB n=1 Tax=Pseudaestuariivita rosea TaxID=2763263 RepID=UPI001ABA0AB1|nr:double-strand break repair protein AddB [Pseudaestuariivita rosea]
MFEPSDHPRVFGLAPGVDFANALIDGLLDRTADQPPETIARVDIYVNTRRMQRRLRQLFTTGPSRLLPKIRLVTEIGQNYVQPDLPMPASKLRRRLELTQLVRQLLDAQPDLAPKSALFDLTDSLADLMDEMHGEGVAPDVIQGLDISDQSGHWQRALEFIKITQGYFRTDSQPDVETRQRMIVEHLVHLWAKTPPRHPVLIAGSTGSRGATAMLMKSVAGLPQGGVILPGFDFDQPDEIWARIGGENGIEDHPQYRFQALLEDLKIHACDVQQWADAAAPSPARNRLISLALRPAPVTDQWLTEGPMLSDLTTAAQKITLVEAPSPRIEATVIAMRLRQAAETAQVAALITPDRQIARLVTAALDRWGIIPDDSAGVPLPQTPPGRFLLQIATLFQTRLTAKSLLSLLKDPMTNTGQDDRGPHLRWIREFELWLRRDGPPFPDAKAIHTWLTQVKPEDGLKEWVHWISDLVLALEPVDDSALQDIVIKHIEIAEKLSGGPALDGEGVVWSSDAGQQVRKVMQLLLKEAHHAGTVAGFEYLSLLNGVLTLEEVRRAELPHSGIMIWGTLEARVQGADLVIIAGMNEGTWPPPPTPDPWLNRAMRKKAGLLMPDRKIGLLAHDFQQAVCANEVWITRPIRNDEAETVPSRWLNRMTNLLGGLHETLGTQALDDMRARGRTWITMAQQLEAPDQTVPPASRPCPRPPRSARPTQLSVTRFKTLVRDPYAIYAQYVLRLKQLDPLHQMPDAPLRGTILHDVFEKFVDSGVPDDHTAAKEKLISVADQVLIQQAPWPAVRRIWRAKLIKIADAFLLGEQDRQARATPVGLEQTGKIDLTGLGFTVTAKADRIDVAADGSVFLYDYKTGNPPGIPEQIAFDRQLLIEAAMIEKGAFQKIGPRSLAHAEFIGLGANPKTISAPLDQLSTARIWDELHQLISAYISEAQGFTARRYMQRDTDVGTYDHLSRFGEWDATMKPMAEDVR